MDQAIFLKQAREAKRMSQAHLALAAGVSKRTVIRAEQNSELSGETLRCICSVLEVAVESVPSRSGLRPVLPPMDALKSQVAANGETLLWTGTPNKRHWHEEARLGGLFWAHLAMVAAGLIAGGIYARVSWEAAGEGMALSDRVPLLALLGVLASLMAVRRVLRGMGKVARTYDEMNATIHALSDKAFYTARVERSAWGWWDEETPIVRYIGEVRRLELPEVRDDLRVRGRTIAWPASRSIRVEDGDGGVHHVQGLQDLDRLAGLMRNDPLAA